MHTWVTHLRNAARNEDRVAKTLRMELVSVLRSRMSVDLQEVVNGLDAEGVIDVDNADPAVQEEYLSVVLDKVAYDTPTEGVNRIAEAFQRTHSCKRGPNEQVATYVARFRGAAARYLSLSKLSPRSRESQLLALVLIQNAGLDETTQNNVKLQLAHMAEQEGQREKAAPPRLSISQGQANTVMVTLRKAERLLAELDQQPVGLGAGANDPGSGNGSTGDTGNTSPTPVHGGDAETNGTGNSSSSSSTGSQSESGEGSQQVEAVSTAAGVGINGGAAAHSSNANNQSGMQPVVTGPNEDEAAIRKLTFQQYKTLSNYLNRIKSCLPQDGSPEAVSVLTGDQSRARSRYAQEETVFFHLEHACSVLSALNLQTPSGKQFKSEVQGIVRSYLNTSNHVTSSEKGNQSKSTDSGNKDT